MKYALRLVVYLLIFGGVYSLSLVILLCAVPVTVTPLKVVRLFGNLPRAPLAESSWRGMDDISPVMVRAVVASEDNNFMKHNGFDWKAIRLAIEENRRRDRRRGASTISQQTAKNVFCLPDRTWLRKGVEAYYTILIELFWSKERIMEVYLNIIETGTNMYGVEATAREVYGKTAAELNADEASMIAAVLPAPRSRKLRNPSNYVVGRARSIRRLMNQVEEIKFK